MSARSGSRPTRTAASPAVDPSPPDAPRTGVTLADPAYDSPRPCPAGHSLPHPHNHRQGATRGTTMSVFNSLGRAGPEPLGPAERPPGRPVYTLACVMLVS